MNNNEIGKQGEDIAVDYLKKRKVKIVARNVRTPFGEIDIIGKKKNKLIFIEVKTRKSETFGTPAEAITKKKLSHITKSAMYYIGGKEKDFEVGAISILMNGKDYKIEYIENIL